MDNYTEDMYQARIDKLEQEKREMFTLLMMIINDQGGEVVVRGFTKVAFMPDDWTILKHESPAYDHTVYKLVKDDKKQEGSILRWAKEQGFV